MWFVFFSLVFFCFYHFLLNPNTSDVQALQQNACADVIDPNRGLQAGHFNLMAAFSLPAGA